MRMVGVVAEYDPFHLGHAHHLREARRLSGADAVVAVMSTVFTQRGEAALFPVRERVLAALRGGADAVLALPALCAVRDAEHFALAGVSLLAAAGCDAVSFGAEHADLERLDALAALLEVPTPGFTERLRAGLDSGLAHPAALTAAAEEALPGSGELLSRPNDTLAVCYLRAVRRLGARLGAVPVARGNDYHATALTGGLPSAGAVRGAVLRGDWTRALDAVPPEARPLLNGAALRGELHRPDALDLPLLAALRTLPEDAPADLADAAEGVGQRVRAAAGRVCTREALLEEAGAKRYPRARLARLCAHVLLGIRRADVEAEPLPPALWLLGFRAGAEPLVARMAEGPLPLLVRGRDLAARDDRWLAVERRAWDLWALGAGRESGLLFTQGLIRAE